MKLATSFNLNGYCNCTVSYRSTSACTYWFIYRVVMCLLMSRKPWLSLQSQIQSLECDWAAAVIKWGEQHRHLTLTKLSQHSSSRFCAHECGWSCRAHSKVCLQSPLVNMFTSSYSNPHKKQLGVPMEHLVSSCWPLTKSTLCLFPMILDH